MSDSDTAPSNAWAQFIRSARQSRGWSIDELASRADVSRMTIIRWEGGATRFRPDTVARVAAALEVPKDEAMRAAFGSDAVAALPHPLVAELARLLDEDSPIGVDERHVLEILIERIVQPYRQLSAHRGRRANPPE